MKVVQKTIKEVDILVDILCDRCGNSCNAGDAEFVDYEYAVLSASWGYYSRKDDTRWDIELCEECADKVKNFIEDRYREK